MGVLGLSEGIRGCLFDLDGVLTRTASLHASAWKDIFDGFLQMRADESSTPFVPFDADSDYGQYVDGLPRAEGTRSFLASRGIVLPEGTPDEPPGAATVHGLSNEKNRLVLSLLEDRGVEVFDGSVRYVQAVRAAGLATAVVSSSANTAEVLQSAGIAELFEALIDGVVARQRGLSGKPAPDTFLAAATELGLTPGEAAVFEDSLAGVEAGRAGAFGLVVGVDRVGHDDALLARGADIVVGDLAELLEDT